MPFREEGHRRGEYGSLAQVYFIAGLHCTYSATGQAYEAFTFSLIFFAYTGQYYALHQLEKCNFEGTNVVTV